MAIVQDEISLVKVKNGVDGGDGKDTYIDKAWSWSADGTDRFTTKYPNENLVSGDKYNISGNVTRNVNDFGFTTGEWAYLIVPNAKLRAIFEPNKRYYVSYKVELLEKVPNTTSYSQDQHGTLLLYADNVKPSHRLGNWVGNTRTDFDSMKVGDIRVRENYIDIPDYMYDAGVNYRILAYGNRVMNPDNTFNKVAKVRFFDFKIEEISKNSMRKTIYTPSPLDDFENAYPKYEGYYSSHNPVQSTNPSDYTWSVIRGENGKDGITPKDVISGYLSNESIIVPATPTGAVTDYSKALGDFVVFEGQIKLVNGVTYSKVSEVNMTSTINSAGRYVVTALSADTGTATYRATYAGVTVDKILIVVKNKQGPSGANGAKGDKGDSGKDGIAGKDGVGVKSTTIVYGISDSESTQPTTWTSSVPSLVKGKYLWTKTVWEYTDNTNETGYVKTYIAKDGNNGEDGIAGKDGVGIKNTTFKYGVSTSGTTKPSDWSTTIPTVPEGQFLWTETTWTYTDNTSEKGYSVAKQGAKGNKGDSGKDGIAGKDGDDAILHTAYSWSADGSDRFTDKYPNENLWVIKELKDGFYINSEGVLTPWPYTILSEKLVKVGDGYLILQYFNPEGVALTDPSGRFNFFDANKKFLGQTDRLQTGTEPHKVHKVQAPKEAVYFNTHAPKHPKLTVKVEQGANATIYTPSPQDDFTNAWPSFIGTYATFDKIQSNNPSDYTWARLRGESGKDGNNGKDGQTPKDVISGYLSNEAIIVPATPTGAVTDYSKAFGDFIVSEGQTKLVNGVTYSKVSEVGMTSSINSNGRYVVTALSADTGTATYRATYAGVTVDKILIVVKNKQGPSGANGAKGDKGDKGDRGAIGTTGPKGEPTGITVSPTVPTNPYINMLWQNTGSNNGYLTGIVYQWNGAKWNTFIFSATNIVAENLAALSTKTGSLDVTGDITLQTDNTVIKGSYDYGDNFGQAYYDRWFDGTFEVGRRFLKYLGNVYQVNPNNTKGDYMCYAESYYGLDYFKMREYVSESNRTLLGRVDIHGQAIQLNDSWGTPTIGLQSNGLMFGKEINVDRIGSNKNRTIQIGKVSGLSEINVAESNIYFNQDRPELADFRIGKDESNLAGGRVIKSESMYDRTYSSAANVVITAGGVLGRSTSARKYKTDIKTAGEVIKNAKKVLDINPSSWIDKGDLSDGIENKRYHGFIADEFDEAGLKEVVVYGANGQIESLAYDRIPIYHNVILKEQEKEIADLNSRIERLEKQLELVASKL